MFNIIWRINSFRSSPTRRINQSQRIHRKLIKVCPSHQPNRILIHKPTRINLVIPEEVVMQPGLAVGILVLQAEGLVISSGYVGFILRFTPTVIIPESNPIAVLIGHFSWNADLVVVEVVGLLVAFAVFVGPVVYLCQRFVAVLVDVDIGVVAFVGVLLK
mgnify:CR=1 FL=1